MPVAPDPVVDFLSSQALVPMPAFESGAPRRAARQLNLGSTSTPNSTSSAAPEPAVAYPSWRELNPVTALEAASPRRERPQIDLASAQEPELMSPSPLELEPNPSFDPELPSGSNPDPVAKSAARSLS
jgi:hypothetical protein